MDNGAKLIRMALALREYFSQERGGQPPLALEQTNFEKVQESPLPPAAKGLNPLESPSMANACSVPPQGVNAVEVAMADSFFTLLSAEAAGNSLGRAIAVVLGQGSCLEKKHLAQAMDSLASQTGFSLPALVALPDIALEASIKPTKPRALKRFLQLLYSLSDGYEENPLGPLDSMDTEDLLEALLRVRGLGMETVDSLVLHVFNRPRFPAGVALYRVAMRHGFVGEEASREEVSEFFTAYLADNTPLMQNFHSDLQRVGRIFCKTSAPACLNCPLQGMLPDALF